MNIPFAISARTAQLIGMENFSHSEGAIVELVKNAYDADADICVVVADIRDSVSESNFYIIDNGTGMTADTIVKHWMTIGTDDKLLNARSKKNNRIKSGAKGIGRFALNRLGTTAQMFTFSDNTLSQGCEWNVNWANFSHARVLSDVEATLDEISDNSLVDRLLNFNLYELPISDLLFKKPFHGTILRISNLNDVWDDDALNSLLKNLEMLIPAHMESAFGIYLYKLQDLRWGGKVNSTEYEDYDYKIYAKFDGVGTITVQIERNELNLSKLETIYGKVFNREAMCVAPYRLEDFRSRVVSQNLIVSNKANIELLRQVGEFEFLFFFLKNTLKDDRDKDGNQKYPYNQIDESNRVHWLDRFGGVRMYRDGFRVRPYGENGDDWLGLGRRQAKSPGGVGQQMGGYRIRPNQIAGVVSISRLTNAAFDDKSSREGIQENDAFALFKNLLLQVIAAFENDRNYIMYNLSMLYKEEHPVLAQAKDVVQQVLKNEGNQNNQSEDSKKLLLLAESYKSLENELSDKDAELSMLRGLASMGISVATFTHELKSVMLRLLPRNELLRNILIQYLPVEQFEGKRFDNPYRELDHMKDEDEKLNNWLLYSIRSIRRSKRDKGDIHLLKYFEDFQESWRPSLQKKHIELKLVIEGMENAVVEGCEMDLDSIFNNYIANSISAFLTSLVDDKVITMTVTNDHGYAVIDFVDNGIGLAKEYINNPDIIFNAFETSVVDNKNNKIGTGMGLFIAKGIINKYTDAMIVLLHPEKGFGIRTMMKIK